MYALLLFLIDLLLLEAVQEQNSAGRGNTESKQMSLVDSHLKIIFNYQVTSAAVGTDVPSDFVVPLDSKVAR